MSSELPNYATRLDALHQALADDFRRMIAYVPLQAGQAVLDVGCGDGYFTALLAERGGVVTGVDASAAFLNEARAHVSLGNVSFTSGDARQLPFEDRSVDLLWSGHSMQSYPDLPQCLSEFRRVLKPGGVLAVLETDNVHSIMLSWPPDLELAVRQAEHREIADEDSYIGTYFPRFASRLLGDSGFVNFQPRYELIHRTGPASAALSEFVRLYLTNLLEVTGDRLSEKMRSRLALLADPHSLKFLPRQPSFFFGSMQVLMSATAP